MSTPTVTPKTRVLVKSILAGIPKLPAAVTSVTVLGTTYTLPALTTALTVFGSLFDAEAKAEADHKAAAEAVDAVAVEATTFIAATKSALKAGLGRKSVALEVVGVAPDKTPAALTPAEEAAKVAKGLATRAARHTLGPKAKAKIKGVVAPAPAPAAQAVPAQAAPAQGPPNPVPGH